MFKNDLEADDINGKCKDYWWTNLLYINNFIPENAEHMVNVL